MSMKGVRQEYSTSMAAVYHRLHAVMEELEASLDSLMRANHKTDLITLQKLLRNGLNVFVHISYKLV